MPNPLDGLFELVMARIRALEARADWLEEELMTRLATLEDLAARDENDCDGFYYWNGTDE